MAKITTKQLIQLVSSAAREPKLREELAADPVTAAKSRGIDIDAGDAGRLRKIAADLARIGTNPNLDEEDAGLWSVGLLEKKWEADVTPPHIPKTLSPIKPGAKPAKKPVKKPSKPAKKAKKKAKKKK